jgi:iron complex outermembrane receptor protein
VFGDRRTRGWDDTTLAGLTYDRELSDQWTLRGRVSYNHYNYDGRYVYDYAEEGEDPYIVVNKEYWKGRQWKGEVQVTGQPSAGHTLTAGSEFCYDMRQDQTTWDEAVYLNDSRHNKDWGVYLQDEFKPLENLTFVAGMRYDWYESFGDTTNPRLGVIYDLLDDTTLKLLYGRAFRAPTVYELYYHDGWYSQKPAEDLEPETIDTYEIVLEHRFSPELWGSISGFHYVMDDLIDQYMDPDDDLLVFRNLDKVTADGIELALNGRWDNGWHSRISYSYVEAEDDAAGEALVDSPKHLAKLNVIAPIIENQLFAGLEVQYDSKTKTLAGDYADDFTLTNLTLTYVNASKRLEISAGIYNLFDIEYAYPGFGEHTQDTIEQDGRTFRIKLTYRF